MNADSGLLVRTLLEQGWLGTASDKIGIHDTVRLGDVGYVNEIGNFVVVENLHTDLIATGGGGATWKHTASYAPGGCVAPSEQPADGDYTRQV